jgi:FkbH-like protein
MKLREALEVIGEPRAGDLPLRRYFLGCSTTPASLETLLQAYLLKAAPDARAELATGLYGDLLGSLERLDPADTAGAAVICEWFDLDPRLGFRRLGGWSPSHFEDILKTAEGSAARLRASLERVADSVPVALCLPTLPLPPMGITVPGQASAFELALRRLALEVEVWAAAQPRVRVVNQSQLDRMSPLAARFQLKAEISHGAPYSRTHADALAELFSRLLVPPAPLKGLITDLDDTLWLGILGEVGPENIAYTLEAHALSHGLYQQFIASLAERGTLVAIASKNDPAIVTAALARPDMAVTADTFFPIETHWGPKSESVARILKAWNIGPDAVAFIDDSPMELEEVARRFPQMRTQLFPKDDAGAVLELLVTLREWFGKPVIREEDRIRARSLSQAAQTDFTGGGDDFLQSLDATLTIELSNDTGDERAFELINKTNQFNLNGRRVTEADWTRSLGSPGGFLLTVSYTDKFGPLGKIAAAVGRNTSSGVRLQSWVMSCRAFSRRIEHATLRTLFEHFGAPAIELDFKATERNGPLQELLTSLELNAAPWRLTRERFDELCPALPQRIAVNSAALSGGLR